MKIKAKITSIILAFVAAFSGVALGYIYVKNLDGGIILAFDEKSLREDESYVLGLYNSSTVGGGRKTVEDFNVLENYLIAEYKLNHSAKAQKVQYGHLLVNAPVIGKVDQYLSSIKTKYENKYQAVQLSKSNMADVANIVEYQTNENVVRYISGGGSKVDASAENPARTLNATFNSSKFSEQSYEDYCKASNTGPETIMQFLLSSKTISDYKRNATKTEGGLYSLSFNANKENSNGGNTYAIGVYYVYEIAKTGGSLVAGTPRYNDLSVTYTIDANWNFVKSEATEQYDITVSISGQKMGSSIASTFVEEFYYGDDVNLYPVV